MRYRDYDIVVTRGRGDCPKRFPGGVSALRTSIYSSAGVVRAFGPALACTSGLCMLSTMSRPPKVISEYMAQLGKKGGEAKGPQKARSPEHYRKAAQARWAKRKETRA